MITFAAGRLSVLCLIAATFTVLPASAQQLSMTVTATGVRVGGVTPGGEVVLFWCAKTPGAGATHLESDGRILADDDNDGAVTLDEQIPLRSVWIAVDHKSGAVVAGARPEFPLNVAPLAPTLFRKDAEQEIAALEQELPRVILFLVRPGLGVWAQFAREGGAGDRDGKPDGRLSTAFEDARPIVKGKEKAPRHLKHGDVVVAVDPGRLDVYLSQVTK